MRKITELNHSVIVACDVKTIEEFKGLVDQTHDVYGIGGYKVGSILAINFGLPKLVQVARKITDLPVIYDHQKAMTDIPNLGRSFVEAVREAGVDAMIGFPQSGPATQEEWTRACYDVGLKLLIGGEMTHPKYKRSEGGYIADEAFDEIYSLAAKLGVENFVVPGNKVERVKHYRSLLEPIVGDKLAFYAPGFIAQGGVITDVAKVAGNHWHAIVGRAIYQASNIRAAAKEMTRQLG